MKNIRICKSHDLSSNSKIFLHIGEKKIHIKGFGLYNISLESGQKIHASHLWTGSNKVKYEDLLEDSTLIIRPRMRKLLI